MNAFKNTLTGMSSALTVFHSDPPQIAIDRKRDRISESWHRVGASLYSASEEVALNEQKNQTCTSK